MNKFLLRIVFCIMGCLMGMSLCAQTADIAVYNSETNPEVSELYLGAAVYAVSDNGKYAVGHGTDYSEYAFIWKRSSGKFDQIKGSFNQRACAYDVSNDGIVVGVFAYDNNGEVTEDGTPYVIPGYWQAGKWTALELEVPMRLGDVNGEARTISPDGRIITGYIYGKYEQTYYDPETGKADAVKSVEKLRPAVWIDGKLQPVGTLPMGNEVGQGIVMNYASADGTVLGGFAEHDSGTRSPAIWKDGKLIRILGKEDIDLNKEDQYWFAGYVACVSPNGKWVCGTWNPEGDGWYSPQYAFVYNVETEEIEYIDGWGIAYYITDDGLLLGKTELMGTALVRQGDFNGSLQDYLETLGVSAPSGLPESIQCISADGSVFAGWQLVMDDFGPMMMPSVAVLSGVTLGLDCLQSEADAMTVDGLLLRAPEAQRISLYDLSGRCLCVVEGQEISLQGFHGVVVAKAEYKHGQTASKQYLLK